MCRPPRLECKNPRRNEAVYHAKRLGFFRDWTVKNAVFRCSSYVALPSIIPHGRGDGERLIHGGGGDVGYSVSRTEWTYLYGALGSGNSFVRYRRDGARCVLQWGATQGTSAYWAAGNLPEQMRPADGNVYVPGVCVSPNGTVENICAYCYVSASTGEVGLQVATTTNRNVRNCGETSWFI